MPTDASRHDPITVAEVERALAPYRDLLPADALAQMREVLETALREHPVATRLARQLTPPPFVAQSGTIARDGATDDRATGSSPSASHASRGRRRGS